MKLIAASAMCFAALIFWGIYRISPLSPGDKTGLVLIIGIMVGMGMQYAIEYFLDRWVKPVNTTRTH
jgi:hypothetical protein